MVDLTSKFHKNKARVRQTPLETIRSTAIVNDLPAQKRDTSPQILSKRCSPSRIQVNSKQHFTGISIPNKKIKPIKNYSASWLQAAAYYKNAFAPCRKLQLPQSDSWSNHVYQYTFKISPKTKDYLQAQENPSVIYFSVPLSNLVIDGYYLLVTEAYCAPATPLSKYTKLEEQQLNNISKNASKL